MKKSLIHVVLFLVILSGNSFAQLTRPDTTRVKIVFAGDMMGHMPQITAAWNDSAKIYDYKPVFNYIKDYITAADIAVVNLEVTLAGKPFSGYPQFSSPDELAENLQATGFDMFITANNHCLDRGKSGLERTAAIIDSLGIYRTGTFTDSADWAKNNPLIIEKENVKLAFLNYTYGTNGMKIYPPNIVNLIDTAIIRRDIEICKARQADFIIVTIHWGIEYERYPSSQQKSLAAFIKMCGANAVIGSHPHVAQPIERFYEATGGSSFFPVVYSLGNFVSNQRDRYKDGGLVVELNLEKYATTKVTSCSYLPVWVYRGTISGKTDYRLIPPYSFDEAAIKLSMSEADKAKCREFYSDTRLLLQDSKETEVAK